MKCCILLLLLLHVAQAIPPNLPSYSSSNRRTPQRRAGAYQKKEQQQNNKHDELPKRTRPNDNNDNNDKNDKNDNNNNLLNNNNPNNNNRNNNMERERIPYNDKSPSSSIKERDRDNFRDRKNKNVVELYTANLWSRFAVGLCASILSFGLMSMLLGMVTSKAPKLITLSFAVASLIATFLPGDFGEFSRALGVTGIVTLRRAKTMSYIGAVLIHAQAAINLRKRKNYPPSDNPWNYKQLADDDVGFNMYTTLLATLLIGAVIGNIGAGYIPFFPSWIGSMIVASSLVLIATKRDSRGDMLRFMGNSVVNGISNVKDVATEVELISRASKLTGKTFVFLGVMDKKYQISDRIKTIVSVLSNQAQGMANRVQKDIEEK